MFKLFIGFSKSNIGGIHALVERAAQQSGFAAMSKARDISKKNLETLELLASGFSGGIGATFEDGTCGGLTGAVMALGLLGKDNAMIKSMSKDLFDAFKAEYGAVTCGEISDNGKDKSPCVELCLFSANEVCKLLKDYDV